MEQTIEVTYQLDYKDIVAAYSSARADANAQFRSGILHWIITFVLVVVGFVGVFAIMTQNETGTTVFLTFIVIIILLTLVDFIYRRSFMKKIWEENKVWHSPIKLVFTEAGMNGSNIVEKHETSWDSFNKVKETEHFFLLYHPNTTFHIIPKRGFKDNLNIETFKNLLKTKMQGQISFLELEKPKTKRRLF